MSNETQETEPQGNSRPVASFSGTGGLHVAIWKNKTESDQEFYSVRVDRSYKSEGDGNYKSTPYLRAGDLLRVQKLLDQADAWIEQDKQKARLVSNQSAMR